MALLACWHRAVAGTSIPLDLQMAWLAEWPLGQFEASNEKLPEEHALWSQVDQIDLISRWVSEYDHYSLSKSTDGKCAIAMTGTNALTDFQENLDVRYEDYCGFSGVHSGAAKEIDDLTKHSNWTQKWLPVLRSGDCSEGVYVVGHSLGGAQASILAACANNGSMPYGFEVKGIYTFGAFAPSRDPLVNKISEKQNLPSGCFDGARYFNQDSGNYDVVPGTTTNAGFRHPQVQAKMLSRRFSLVREAPIEVFQYPCNTKCAALFPTDEGSFSVPSIMDHSMGGAYLKRMLDVYNESKGVKSKIHPEEHGECETNPVMLDNKKPSSTTEPSTEDASGADDAGVIISLFILLGVTVQMLH